MCNKSQRGADTKPEASTETDNGEKIDKAAFEILKKYRHAFEELAK